VFIGAHCVIKEDVPRGSTVTLKTECQVVRERVNCDSRDPLELSLQQVLPSVGERRKVIYGVET